MQKLMKFLSIMQGGKRKKKNISQSLIYLSILTFVVVGNKENT